MPHVQAPRWIGKHLQAVIAGTMGIFRFCMRLDFFPVLLPFSLLSHESCICHPCEYPHSLLVCFTASSKNPVPLRDGSLSQTRVTTLVGSPRQEYSTCPSCPQLLPTLGLITSASRNRLIRFTGPSPRRDSVSSGAGFHPARLSGPKQLYLLLLFLDVAYKLIHKVIICNAARKINSA